MYTGSEILMMLASQLQMKYGDDKVIFEGGGFWLQGLTNSQILAEVNSLGIMLEDIGAILRVPQNKTVTRTSAGVMHYRSRPTNFLKTRGNSSRNPGGSAN